MGLMRRTRRLLPMLLLFLGSAAARSVAGPDTACAPGYIPHSNVSEAHSSPCTGGEGTLCPFNCDPGFLAIGRHACQSYTTHDGKAVLSNVFFGGRCAAWPVGRTRFGARGAWTARASTRAASILPRAVAAGNRTRRTSGSTAWG